MKKSAILILAGIFGVAGSFAFSAGAQQQQEPEYGSLPRHQLALVWGVPEPYRSLRNPLSLSSKTVKRGADVYSQNCALCHGDTGLGDGPVGKNLSPTTGNLAWLSRMPMATWDPFMYWTIAEGGTQFGTAMPPFKDALSHDDIWAVITYIQARLPKNPK